MKSCNWKHCSNQVEEDRAHCSAPCRNKDYVDARRRKVKEMAFIYKGGKCAACGYSRCITAIDFHHLVPSQKDFGVGNGNTTAWAKVREELDKCVALCSNCHREVHAGMLYAPELKSPSPSEGETFLRAAKMLPPDPNPTPRCRECGDSIPTKGARCLPCFRRSREKAPWPSHEDLLAEILWTSRSQVARRLGVSETAVRHRLRTREG